MNEEVFITALKRSNVILIDELYDLFISKQKVKDAIDKHFVHGYIENEHNRNCRMCKVKKELGIE